MKTMYFILLSLFIVLSANAQSRITVSSGSITINGTAHGVTDVAYEANYSAGRIAIYNKFNPNVVYLRGEPPMGVINGSTSTLFSSMDEAVTYLSSGGVGSQPSGGGGSGGGGSGGGGDASAANQSTEIARLTSILNKIITAPATEAKQDAGNASLLSIDSKMQSPTSNPTLTSVTAGTTSGVLLSADAAGYTALIQLPSTATVSVFIKDDGTAANTGTGSIEIVPGGSYLTPRKITTAINAISTVSQSVTVRKAN